MVKSNRAYTLVFAYLAGAVIIAALTMFTNNPNWRFILEWYGGLGLTVIGVIGAKEVGKIGKSFAERKTGSKK